MSRAIEKSFMMNTLSQAACIDFIRDLKSLCIRLEIVCEMNIYYLRVCLYPSKYIFTIIVIVFEMSITLF